MRFRAENGAIWALLRANQIVRIESDFKMDLIKDYSLWKQQSLNMAFDSSHNESELLNSTSFASQVITSSFSMLCYVVVFVLSVLSVCFKPIRKFLASPARHIFFLIAGILTSVAVLNTRHGKPDVIRGYHVTVSAFLVGVVLVLLGAVLFFEKPRIPSDQATLGKNQPSMGLLLTIITLPLCAIGLLILIQEQASKGEAWMVLAVNQAVFIVQKVIQAAVYVWLRDFRVRESCRENARFYFEVLAFFNFIDWLNTQATLNTSFDMEQAKNFYGEWFGFLFRIYKALLIDYRLLCSLLFLEHSIQVQNETADAEMIDGGSGRIEISSTPINRQNRNIGFVVGFCCLLIPLICALHYFRKLHVAAITRAVATLLGALIILASGGALLRKNRFDYDIRHTESKAVKIMVSEKGYLCYRKRSQTCELLQNITVKFMILFLKTQYEFVGQNTAIIFYLSNLPNIMTRNRAWVVVLIKCNFYKITKGSKQVCGHVKGKTPTKPIFFSPASGQ